MFYGDIYTVCNMTHHDAVCLSLTAAVPSSYPLAERRAYEEAMHLDSNNRMAAYNLVRIKKDNMHTADNVFIFEREGCLARRCTNWPRPL